MSSKRTILLTKESEHWYHDCLEPLNDEKDVITLEFDKNNIRVDLNDEDDLVISVTNPNSDLYGIISNLKGKVSEQQKDSLIKAYYEEKLETYKKLNVANLAEKVDSARYHFEQGIEAALKLIYD